MESKLDLPLLTKMVPFCEKYLKVSEKLITQCVHSKSLHLYQLSIVALCWPIGGVIAPVNFHLGQFVCLFVARAIFYSGAFLLGSCCPPVFIIGTLLRVYLRVWVVSVACGLSSASQFGHGLPNDCEHCWSKAKSTTVWGFCSGKTFTEWCWLTWAGKRLLRP